MRLRVIGRALLAAAVFLASPGSGRAQEGGGFQVPGNTFPTLPIPTGGGPNSGSAGFYGAVEFVFLTQTRAIGDQTVAYRGLIDSSGRITGVPGTYLGSGRPGLTTDGLGKTNFFPGYNIELGYKFDDGTKIYGNFMQLFEANYTDGATLATQYGRSDVSLNDTFLTAGVFNFSPQFAGPQRKTAYDYQAPPLNEVFAALNPQQATGPFNILPVLNLPIGPNGRPILLNTPTIVPLPGGSFLITILNQPLPGTPGFNPGFNSYGIWNAASVMNLKFSQRFTASDIGISRPLFQTDYSRVYGLAGARYAWFFERFTWQTMAIDAGDFVNTLPGGIAPFYVADYTNTLSQRLYGPYVGCGHEVYLGNAFAASLDLTGSALLGIVKQRAKYELGDESTQSKRGYNAFSVVPNLNGNFNMWWYPTEGVQIRLGYQAQTFYGTKYMREPIGFNFAAPDPAIDTKWFRVIHGVNVGMSLFF